MLFEKVNENIDYNASIMLLLRLTNLLNDCLKKFYEITILNLKRARKQKKMFVLL